MSFSGNIVQNWRLWYQKFTIYKLATQNDNLKQKVQNAKLLNCIGREGLRIYNASSLIDRKDVKKYD